MPTNNELRATQKRTLYGLLLVKKDLGENESRALSEFILATMAEMDAEDVAYVEKLIKSLPS